MSPVPKLNFEFLPYNLHKRKWPPNGQKTPPQAHPIDLSVSSRSRYRPERPSRPAAHHLHRKFTNNRFCACSVQMLLKIAVNATKCSTFEVQYGKSSSTRTTAIRHFRVTLTDRVISRMRTNSSTA